ncbi:MAG TPA: hypothetical protein EYP60_03930 [bacterium (Candidatus Stahlbacteria)]|nr:hypothetical protein [Candidatus Stahlbacteria bacterium]
MIKPKLTYKGIIYSYTVTDGKVCNRVVGGDVKTLLESEEIKGFEDIPQEDIDAINEMIISEFQESDIPWEDILKEDTSDNIFQ